MVKKTLGIAIPSKLMIKSQHKYKMPFCILNKLSIVCKINYHTIRLSINAANSNILP